MTILSAAVQQAIQADLPGMVATELKDFIAKAEKDAQNVQRLTEQLANSESKVSELRSVIQKHLELDTREAEIEKQTNALFEKELSLLRREAFMDAKTAQAELQGVKETTSQFLRNVTFRENVIADVSKPVEGSPSPGQGMYGTPGMLQRNGDGKPDTTTVTRTAE